MDTTRSRRRWLPGRRAATLLTGAGLAVASLGPVAASSGPPPLDMGDAAFQSAALHDADLVDKLRYADDFTASIIGDSQLAEQTLSTPAAATETPKAQETADPTDTPDPTEAPRATETPEPTDTPEATDTPEPTETPEATDTPKASETPEPTDTPKASETPDASSSDQPGGDATSSSGG